jgi:predicted transcriptional regulator
MKRETRSFVVDPEVWERIRAIAHANRLSTSRVAETALRHYLDAPSHGLIRKEKRRAPAILPAEA